MTPIHQDGQMSYVKNHRFTDSILRIGKEQSMQMFSRKDPTGTPKRSYRWLSFLSVVLLTTASLAFAALNFAPSNTTSTARAATVWTQIWGDEFNGAAGT